jgi:hypothetical protein
LKFIDAIKLDVHFGRSFLNGIYQKRTRALREMTETACEFTGKFGMSFAFRKEKGDKECLEN